MVLQCAGESINGMLLQRSSQLHTLAVWWPKLIPDTFASFSSSIESGYFAVLECEPPSLLEAPLARRSSEIAPIDSTPVSRPNSGPDKRTKQYRMIWTPNDHFKSGCLADSPIDNDPGRRPESPLPTGWDMAYDPITGHDYFIDHATGTTTWERPLSPDLDPPG